MRKTFIYIIAILAAAAALSSCAKETPGPKPASEDGERVISATFGSASKSTLGEDGLTPEFKEGDLILVSNGTATPQVCTLRVSGTLSTFTTKLEGTLTAVYPKDAAVVSGNSITGVKVPSNQTGLFKDANIAMAENITDHATFNNKTAMLRFYVDASIGVKSITVTSTANIANEGSDLKQIVVDPDGDALISTVTTGNPDPRLCYVAVLPDGINAKTLTFTSVTSTQETVTRTTNATILKASGMYNAFIPYYIDMGTAGKWGYCNVGAFLPEDYGRYFMWGETVGQVPTGDTFSFPNTKYYTADNSTWIASEGFSWKNCPWTNGNKVFTKYSVGNKTVLDLADDAAYVNWGKNWRMPTGGNESTADYTILAKACKEGYTSGTITPNSTTSVPTAQGVYFYNVSGSEGIYFVDASGNKLFFPAARGGGYDNRGGKYLELSPIFCEYFTSTLGPNNSSLHACTFHYDKDTKVEPQNDDCMRAAGRTIRPKYNEGSGVINGGYEDAGEY